VACLSRRSDHAILLAFHGNPHHDSAPATLASSGPGGPRGLLPWGHPAWNYAGLGELGGLVRLEIALAIAVDPDFRLGPDSIRVPVDRTGFSGDRRGGRRPGKSTRCRPKPLFQVQAPRWRAGRRSPSSRGRWDGCWEHPRSRSGCRYRRSHGPRGAIGVRAIGVRSGQSVSSRHFRKMMN